MKRREMILANLSLLGLVCGFSWLTYTLSVNPITNQAPQVEAAHTQQTNGCTSTKPLTLTMNDSYLKRLGEYQTVCSSFVTNSLMVFTGFSETPAVAQANASAMAVTLRNFKQAGVSPIIIVEPYISQQAMSYKSYLSGAYDTAIDTYFKALKASGITDDMMGMWVPFPESNTPSWNNKDTEPHDFVLCVNKYLTKLKQYFPGAKGSVLLSAVTYEPTDAEWDNGDYISLSQYVVGLDRNLVTSFGIQGFPWVTNAKLPKRTVFKAAEFLQPDLAISAAQELRTRDIWINSGTFASKYTNDPSLTVHLSINERKALLDGILQVATSIRDYQQNAYRVSINLFSEDKSNTPEATDWSYFQDDESKATFKDFIAGAQEQHIPVSLYDIAK